MMTIRPYDNTRDRASLLTWAVNKQSLDSPTNRILVLDELNDAGKPTGLLAGFVFWTRPDAGDEAYLGAVNVAMVQGSFAQRRRAFYELIRAAVQDIIADGFTRGFFSLFDERLLAQVDRDFNINSLPSARHPTTGQPVQWDIHVNLADALDQLNTIIDP